VSLTAGCVFDYWLCRYYWLSFIDVDVSLTAVGLYRARNECIANEVSKRYIAVKANSSFGTICW